MLHSARHCFLGSVASRSRGGRRTGVASLTAIAEVEPSAVRLMTFAEVEPSVASVTNAAATALRAC